MGGRWSTSAVGGRRPARPLHLVIDDLHELISPDALAQLTRLLTNLPGDVHAVLATRRDLPLRLHQLRLAGELAEIRAADLRFSERETRELLDASGIALSDAGAALLHQRTEGGRRSCGSRRSHWPIIPDPERFRRGVLRQRPTVPSI
jgi:LuxR family maltose regulon positive regulatory protein